MIIVDTSALISFLKGKKNSAVDKFEHILKNKVPYGINYYIYQEVLQGAKNEKEFKLLKEYLGSQKFYNLKNGQKSHEDAAKLYFKCRAAGYTVKSTIDLLIAQTAIENNLSLLHNDAGYVNIARIITDLQLL
jgi:hypothetical protein